MEPGLDPVVLSFASPSIRPDNYALHCGNTWKDNAVSALRAHLPEDPPIVHGFVPRATSQVFPSLPTNALASVWDLLAKAPHFSLIPTSWWRGDPLRAKEVEVYEMWVDRAKRTDNQPYAFERFVATI